MATVEGLESEKVKTETLPTVDLLVGIAGPAGEEEILAHALETASVMTAAGTSMRIGYAYPQSGGEGAMGRTQAVGGVNLLRYVLPTGAAPALPWLASRVAYRAIAKLATSVGARTCVIIAQDLAALTRSSIDSLAAPLMEGSVQLTMPLYRTGRYEGLLNTGILYPFTRALYGRQIRYPLALDFGLAGAMLTRLASEEDHSAGAALDQTILWPGVEGALTACPIVQTHLDVLHTTQSDGVTLSTVLSQLMGTLFEGAEKNASSWQRIRTSHATAITGVPSSPTNDDDRVDVKPLIESFSLGSRNLQEIWSLVLPPVTLLELKRLARLPVEQFRMPDGIWARIIYDFALAHRLRTISRTHLLGALTPLYLGWVASYAQEVRTLDSAAGEVRIEQLAKAFEDSKPYFVSRWRWPDRFNP